MSFVKMPVMVLLLLLILVCADADAEEQKSSRQRVNPNAMWIAAVAAGFGMLVLTIAVLIASTFLLRRYERKRLMLLAPMLARLQSPTTGNANDDPHQVTAAGPPASSPVNIEMTNHEAPSVNAAQSTGVGHVYYNRGLDVDEGDAETTQHLDPRPIEIVDNRRESSGKENSVI